MFASMREAPFKTNSGICYLLRRIDLVRLRQDFLQVPHILKRLCWNDGRSAVAFFSFLLYNVHIFSRQSPISYVIPRICFCFYNWRDLTFWISTKFQLLLRANPCHIFMMVQDTRSIQFVISFDLGFEILPVCPPSYCCIWLRALFPPLPVLYNGILCLLRLCFGKTRSCLAPSSWSARHPLCPNHAGQHLCLLGSHDQGSP